MGPYRCGSGPGGGGPGRGLRSVRSGHLFLHDVEARIAAEGEPYQRAEADIVFESVCDFTSWPAIRIRVLVGADDRFFPVGFQRRVARERLGVEADVLPGGHLLPLVQPRQVADYLLQSTDLP